MPFQTPFGLSSLTDIIYRLKSTMLRPAVLPLRRASTASGNLSIGYTFECTGSRTPRFANSRTLVISRREATSVPLIVMFSLTNCSGSAPICNVPADAFSND